MPGTQLQIDIVDLIEEIAAIYVHAEVEDGLTPELLAQWREEIEIQVKAYCVESFDLSFDQVEIEIVLFEGSIWTKIKPKLATIGLILSLYNGVHSAPANLINDWQKFAHGTGEIVEKVTNGAVDRIEGAWENLDALHELVQRSNPSTPQEPDEKE